jgi:hypothetical protein
MPSINDKHSGARAEHHHHDHERHTFYSVWHNFFFFFKKKIDQQCCMLNTLYNLGLETQREMTDKTKTKQHHEVHVRTYIHHSTSRRKKNNNKIKEANAKDGM